MSEQHDGAGTRAPAPGDARASELEAYIRANRATVTEDALRRAALDAGHPPAAIEAALAATRGQPTASRMRVGRNVFLAYLAVFLILSLLMILNPANDSSGFLGDTAGLGILILSMALGTGLVASLAWITSRRLFLGLIGAAIALSGITAAVNQSPLSGLIAVVLGVGLVIVAARVGRAGPQSAPASTALLLSVPLLILLVVGGICVASGLPIPRPA